MSERASGDPTGPERRTGSNRLANETSPYLRQHQDNPVDWYPWGDEAFERARAEDKLVFLSIGYSACHWCHVMAHESFEDDETAAIMNELFVNVKVDREERPDVDAVYMEATQAMTGGGGWPMSVFITPDGQPVFAGTYFPKGRVGNRASFTDLMHAVEEAWRNRRDQVAEQAQQLTDAVRARTTLVPEAAGEPDQSMLEAAYTLLRQNHDDLRGGFGGAPKFPQPSFGELLFRAYSHNRSLDTLAVLETTLDAMASGGIYDHLGGGFARYSVDAEWLVPHFEKMLYDQAQLLRLYTHGWQVTGHERWRVVVEETVEYVLRDLRRAGGGIASAEDADSEGEEGKFYVWSLAEIQEILGDDAGPAIQWWGVTEDGNFEGHNILFRRLGDELVRPDAISDARRRLFKARENRVRPGLDDKVLTEWNAMWVAALAEAGAAFGRSDWIRSAVRTAEFLLANLRRDDGRWLRSWQEDGGADSASGAGRARHLAYAVDHAWLVEAFTRLAEATGERRWITEARTAARATIELFWDDEFGGLFTTAKDAEALIVRARDLTDGATPSANGVAAVAFTRLAALVGDEDLDDHAIAILRSVGEPMGRQPTAFTYALAAVDLQVNPLTEVVVAGDRPDLVAAVHRRFLPSAVLAWGERHDSPLWEGRDEDAAYVCEDYTCQLPARTVEELEAQLGG